jgi:DNA-binding transcriptional regulator YdaS (Cro superfamily)
MKILHIFSTKAAAARALGVSGEAVRKWCKNGVPPERVIEICRSSSWRVTPHLLRPDIYPNPSDALPANVAAVSAPEAPVCAEVAPRPCQGGADANRRSDREPPHILPERRQQVA